MKRSRKMAGVMALILSVGLLPSRVSAEEGTKAQPLVESLQINIANADASLTNWVVGDSGKITVSVTPDGASKDVTWSVTSSLGSNPFTIDADGNFTIPNFLDGIAVNDVVTIAATATDGSGVSASRQITVRATNAGGSHEKEMTIKVLPYNTVTYYLNGGYWRDPSMQNTTIVYEGDPLDYVFPEKDGYIFDAWYTDEDLTNPFDFNTPISSDVNLYAGYEKAWKSTVDMNGGLYWDESSFSLTQPEGWDDAIPTITTIEYWLAEGWLVPPKDCKYIGVEINGVFYPLTDTPQRYKPTSDTLVKAIWEIPIHYHLNGGTLNGQTGTVTLPAQYGKTITLPLPTREGYTFDHWEDSSNTAVASYLIDGSYSFTAVWKKNNSNTNNNTNTNTNANSNTAVPETGDSNTPMMWAFLMLASLLGLAMLIHGKAQRGIGRK